MPPAAHVNKTVETDASNTHTAQRNTSLARQQQFQARMMSLDIPLNGTPHSINTVVQRVEAGGQHPVQRKEDFKYLQRTIGNQAVVQLLDRMKAAATADIHKTTAAGVQGTGSQLPHVDKIQQAFGQHDISGVQAFTGTKAATASKAIGAKAYATGNKIAFSSPSPDLHTAAHEATHVLQQRAGVHLNGGVGEIGDGYERHADAVADKVVKGQSAEGLINHQAGGRKANCLQRLSMEPRGNFPGIEANIHAGGNVFSGVDTFITATSLEEDIDLYVSQDYLNTGLSTTYQNNANDIAGGNARIIVHPPVDGNPEVNVIVDGHHRAIWSLYHGQNFNYDDIGDIEHDSRKNLGTMTYKDTPDAVAIPEHDDAVAIPEHDDAVAIPENVE